MTTVAVDRDPPAPAPGETRAERGPVGLPHVDALDGLRGLAVAAVLVHHGEHLKGGFLGVDLFFVLSGYLITGLLLAGWRQDGRVGLREFWARRARRLAPALLVTLVAVGAYAAWVAVPAERLAVRNDGLATLFEVANWRGIATSNDYFARTLRPSPLAHTWSLSIEEQLYLFWPLVVAGVLAWKRRPHAVLVASLAGAAASAAAMVGFHALGFGTTRLYYGTDTRACAVLLGAALAAGRMVLGPRRWAGARPLRQALGLVAAAGLAVAWTQLDGSTALPYQGAIPLASLAGMLVIAAVADRRHPGPLGRIAAVAPLRLLGLISYGVYLYHYPIYLWLDQERVGVAGWALLGVRVAVTLVVAAVSYRYLEQPFRRGWGRGRREVRAALPAGAAVAAIALFAGTLGAVGPPSIDDLANSVDRATDPNAPLVLLAGDSVPLLLGVELAKERDQLGVSIANRGLPGCHLLASLGPIRGIEGNIRTDVTDCSLDGEYARQVRAVHPAVAMVLFGEFPNESVRLHGRWTMACRPDYLSALRTRIDSLVDDLRVDRTPVVLVTAPGSSLSWVLDRVACSNDVLDQIAAARPGVSVVDLASYVCPPDDECLQEIDGNDLREDGLHFTGAGGAFIGSWLIPRVLAAVEPG